MSAFRRRGLKVVVDTTAPAEFDFAKLGIPERRQEAIAENLRKVSWSKRDRHAGRLSIREISGYDVAFIGAHEESAYVVAIVAVEFSGELESLIELAKRATFEQLPPAAQAILQGRRKTDD